MRLHKKEIKELSKTIYVYGDMTEKVVRLSEDLLEACELVQLLRDRVEEMSIKGARPGISMSALVVKADEFLKEPKQSPRKDPNPSEG